MMTVIDKTLIAFSRNEVLNDCVDKALSGESKNGDTTVKGRALQIAPFFSPFE